MGLGPIAFILSLLAQDVWSMRQASNATGGCDSLFGRKCCSSRCNGIRDGSHKDSGVENLELYECIVTEGASGKPMPSYGAYDWDEKPVTSKQLNDWIAGYRGYRTAGIEYSDYVCQETCRYVTKGEPKDPSPSDGRDKVKVYRAGGVEPERGELALCVSKGEKQSSDKEEKMRDGLDAIRQAQQDWEARRTVTEPIEQEKEQEKALAEEEEGNKNLEDRSKVVEQKPIRVPYLPNNEDHVDDDEIEDVLPLVGDDYGNKLLPWVEDHIIDERFLVGEDRPSDNALDILNMVGKRMYLQQEKKWKGLSEAEKKAKRQEEKDQAIADYLASAKGQEEVAEQKNPKVSRKQKLKSKRAAARAKIFGK